MPAIFAIPTSDAECTTYKEEEAPIPLYARNCADQPRSPCVQCTRASSSTPCVVIMRVRD